MSFPAFYVTYAVMDGDAGASPFWHACLILSEQASATAPIRVVDSVGFYSQPSSTTNPLVGGIKHMLGFDVDLQDGHGILKQEKMRDLDGNGLHGKSFAVTQEQFTQLTTLYKENMRLEQQAIEELNVLLLARGEAANGYTRYIEELALAARDGRPSRLKPFHITMDLNSNGFDSRASHACKNYALTLLLETNIINETMRDTITGGTASHAFPRFSNLLTPLRLVSTGEPTQCHSKTTGKTFYNREWDTENKLFWATTPQIKTSEPSKPEIQTTQNQCEFIKNMLTRVCEIEIMLREKINELEDITTNRHRRWQLKIQLTRVQQLYETFSIANENQRPHYLAAKLLHAETTLNVAIMTLTPNRVNYPFLLRAYDSIAVGNAMLCLLGLLIAATFLSGPVGIIWMSIAALSTGQQLYGFFKEETQFAKMRADYTAFQGESHNTKTEDEYPDLREDCLLIAIT